MPHLIKIQVSKGIYWVEAPDAGVSILCGCPADSVKHLMKRGLIGKREEGGVVFETGPNAILLSDVPIQNGVFTNLAEFPVLQMLYRQGMILPNHPNNTGQKPLLVGSEAQVKAQMDYIYRGNYGLTSEEEMVEAGLSPAVAHDMMRLKLKFAFGRIRRSEELLDAVIVGKKPVEMRNGVFIRRLRLNIFEIRCKNQTVTVDLNLPRSVRYESPYMLGFHDIRREYFGVIHSGQGDGWDPERPAMASILMFQGKIYLIDGGPNIAHNLKALGIGINEIEGIFHSHAHDDHFGGLPVLARSGHRIKYYSTALVRTSVAKKITALASTDEGEFPNYFEVHDLTPDIWNDIDGLEVKPIFSPHPVETNILLFRAMSADGYKTYAHLADIVGLDLLRGMVTTDESAPGISPELFSTVAESYLERADLKKIDVGGGLIHGNAEDFKEDASAKIILSHTSEELTLRQREIGSGAPFGMADCLIRTDQDYLRMNSYRFLEDYFPRIPPHQLRLLANSPMVVFNPESILLKSGICNHSIYLIVSGEVEMLSSKARFSNTLSAGALIGEIQALAGVPLKETYVAASFVHALELPSKLYLHFIEKNALHDAVSDLRERRRFLQKTWLLGEYLAYPIQNRIAGGIKAHTVPASEEVAIESGGNLLVVRSGKVHLLANEALVETLRSGDFFREECVLFNTPCFFRARVVRDAVIYSIPQDEVLDIPVVRWKLSQISRRRREILFNPGSIPAPPARQN